MGKFDFLGKMFRAKNPLDAPPPVDAEDAKSAQKPQEKRTSVVMRPPPSQTRISVDPWWVRKSKAGSHSIHLSRSQKDLGKHVSHRVNTGRLSLPVCRESVREVGRLLRTKTSTDEDLAKLLTESACLREFTLRQLTGEEISTLGAPENPQNWLPVLRELDISRLLRECIYEIARVTLRGNAPKNDILSDALWEHSLATALATEYLCGIFKFKRVALANSCAVFHDLGRSIIYNIIREETGQESPPSDELVKYLCRNLHEEAGQLAARELNLPDIMVQIAGNHHADIDPQDRLAALRAIVQLADQSAIRCGHADMETDKGDVLIALSCAKYLHIDNAKAQVFFEPIPRLMLRATG